jgi:hypothetical protein
MCFCCFEVRPRSAARLSSVMKLWWSPCDQHITWLLILRLTGGCSYYCVLATPGTVTVSLIIIIIIKLPDQAIASTPSAPRPLPRGGRKREHRSIMFATITHTPSFHKIQCHSVVSLMVSRSRTGPVPLAYCRAVQELGPWTALFCPRLAVAI